MAIGSISGSGLEGINKGFNIVGAAADKIAKISGSEDPSGDLTSSAVDLLRGKVQTQASAKVLQTEGEIIGTLLDITV